MLFLLLTVFGCLASSIIGIESDDDPSMIIEKRDDAYVVMKYGITPDKVEQTDFTPEEAPPCQCGTPSRLSARIVGGKPKTIEEYPWMAGLVAFDNIFCGGAIVNDRYILTAAHCFKIKPLLKHVRVRLGSTIRMDNRHDHDVEEIVTHKYYNTSRSGYYDIALVKLLKPLKFTDKIRPICLPEIAEDYTGQYGTVAGWGTTTHGGLQSPTLTAVDMKVIDIGRCIKLFQKLDRRVEHDINLCAGGVLNQDACQGDSGGPLFQQKDDVYRQIGIVSWGIGCAIENIPGIYTNVFALLPWIIQHMKVPPCSPPE